MMKQRMCLLAAAMVIGSLPTLLRAQQDDRLLSELAARELNSLLEFAFDQQKVPVEARAAYRGMNALRRLGDPGVRLTVDQQQKLVRQAVVAVRTALPTMKDPEQITQQALLIYSLGAARDVNAMEFWGEDPQTQARLRPVAEAVTQLLDRASQVAGEQAEALGAQIVNPNQQALIARWQRLDDMASTAKYNRHMLDLALVMSIDKADPKRREVANAAVNYLREFDNPESTVQPLVRLTMGRLLALVGEHNRALELLKSVATLDPALAPKPTVDEEYNARYFHAQTQMLAGKLTESADDLKKLEEWQTTTFAGAPKKLDGVRAASTMMHYRLALARAERAQNAEARAKHEEEGLKVLLNLVEKRPDLLGVVFQRLLDVAPQNLEMAKANTLLLQAMIARAEEELRKEEEAQVDRNVLTRGINACRELLARRESEKLAPRLVDTVAVQIGRFQMKLGEPVAAAGSFLDYIEKYASDASNRQTALEHAKILIGQQRAAKPDDEAVAAVYERFLPIAIAPPFGQREFAFEYARRLDRLRKPREAMKFYAMVPPNDNRLPDARYFMLMAKADLLEAERATLTGTERAELLTSIEQARQETGRVLAQAASAAATPELATRYRVMNVRLIQTAADIARTHESNPRKVLQLLEGIEKLAADFPDAARADVISDANIERVNAYMALGENTKASEELLKYLRDKPGGEGAGIVFTLLTSIDKDLDSARVAGNAEQTRRLALARAALTPKLVDWAAANSDPNIRRSTYRYRVFDAASQQLAAQTTQDEVQRKALLEEALKRFLELQNAENLKAFHDSLPEGSPLRAGADPYVRLGTAMVLFDLKRYEEVEPILFDLLSQRRLGPEQIPVDRDGQIILQDNELYWEARYKLIRCYAELARQDPAKWAKPLEAAKIDLRSLYVRFEQPGGRKFRLEFEQLRRELIPDFNPAALTGTTRPGA